MGRALTCCTSRTSKCEGNFRPKYRCLDPSLCQGNKGKNGTLIKLLFILNRHLVELGCIKPLCDLLTLMDSKIVQVALNGLENILRLGELEAKRGGGINPYCALIEEAYGNSTHSGFYF